MHLSSIHNGILAAWMLCSSCTHSQSCCEFVCSIALACPPNAIVLWAPLTPISYTHSASSFEMIPKPWGEGCAIAITIRAENPTFSYSLYNAQFIGLCIGYHLLQKEGCSIKSWKRHFSTRIKNLEDDVIQCWFSRIIVLVSPLGSMT